MSVSLRLSFATLICFLLAISLTGQSKATGSVSGKITIGDRPAKGVPVVARISGMNFPPKPISASASTNENGEFILTGLAPGTYLVSPYQPADVGPITRVGAKDQLFMSEKMRPSMTLTSLLPAAG